MKKYGFCLLAIGVGTFCQGLASAEMLTLNFSGEFGPTTTLGGKALGDGTAFSFVATFDSTTGFPIQAKAFSYAATASFTIAGYGTFATAPGADLYVGIEEISGPLKGYGVALSNLAATHTFGAVFRTASTPFNASAPVATVFSDLITTGGFFNLPISLQGGVGDLVVNDLVKSVGSASISATASAVPEPASLALSGMSLGVIGMFGWRRGRRSPAKVG